MLIRTLTLLTLKEELDKTQGQHSVVHVLYHDVAKAADLAAVLGWRVEAVWNQAGLPYRNLVHTSMLLRHCPP